VGEESDYLDIAIPNPNKVLLPASVKASFCFSLGRFYRDYGTGPRRGSVMSSGLDLHLIDFSEEATPENAGLIDFSASDLYLTGAGENVFREIAYQDGGGAISKANSVAAPLLGLSSIQQSGGFTRHGVAGTALTSVIDRVSVSINFTGGVTETVEFTKARATGIPFAERTLQRIQRTEELFSGQEALKREIREY